MITIEKFQNIFPYCKEPNEWVQVLNETLSEYEINTTQRIAAFIAQCGHESAGWSRFIENLNYSAKALNAIFPKYFRNAGRNAEDYHRNPEAIANVIYANRMGNGDIKSGDGWKYRGRGPIQLTGKNNYINFSNDYETNVVDYPDIILEDKVLTLMTAIWYWKTNNLNKYADEEDLEGLTKRINGGYHGLEERINLYNHLIKD